MSVLQTLNPDKAWLRFMQPQVQSQARDYLALICLALRFSNEGRGRGQIAEYDTAFSLLQSGAITVNTNPTVASGTGTGSKEIVLNVFGLSKTYSSDIFEQDPYFGGLLAAFGGDTTDLMKSAELVSFILSRDYSTFYADLFVSALFGDTTATKFSSGGQYSNSLSAQNLATITFQDGIWAQYVAATSGTGQEKTQRVVISENTGSPYAAQEMTTANAFVYIQKMINAIAPIVNIVQSGGGQYWLMINQGWFNALRSLRENSLLTAAHLENVPFGVGAIGAKTVEVFRTSSGVNVFACPMIDTFLSDAQNNGTKIINPNRGLLFTPDNNILGYSGAKSDTVNTARVEPVMDGKAYKKMAVNILALTGVTALRPYKTVIAY